ncbi:unnamed protein product [Cuscuta epithymum]|uniref:Late embryogenesis abundant protein LEA-2 subgroup domain-containing protein n=1 Tax=Cuscuta epithymum TaxID=186058 RepID=A0AAV0ESA7_9ASTE|nr:unnamed protein product [Cuscuta epithymum]
MPPSTTEPWYSWSSPIGVPIFVGGFLLFVFAGIVAIGIYTSSERFVSPTPKVRIYGLTLSPELAPADNNSTATESPPLTATCTVAFSIDNNNDEGVYEYNEIEVLVVWEGRNETFMRANPKTFTQGSLERKPVLLAATDLPVPRDLQSTVDYTFTINMKSRVRQDPGTGGERAFYIKATCEEVKVGFRKTQSVDRVATMLDGPQMCGVVKLKSSFNL